MKLYKYAVADRLDVLKNGFIRFTPPIHLNDPLEMRPLIKRMVSDSDLEKMVLKPLQAKRIEDFMPALRNTFIKEIPNAIKETLTEDQLEAGFKLMIEQIREGLEENLSSYIELVNELAPQVVNDQLANALQMLRTDTAVLSLSETPDSVLMWAYYAENNTGIVIELDSDHNFFKQELGSKDDATGLHKIVYTKYRPNLEAFIVEDVDINSLFFTKDVQWKHEREWRMVKLVKDADKVIGDGTVHLFTLPISTVSAIIIGCQATPDYRKQVEQLLASDPQFEHISLKHATMNQKNFGLIIEPAI